MCHGKANYTLVQNYIALFVVCYKFLRRLLISKDSIIITCYKETNKTKVLT